MREKAATQTVDVPDDVDGELLARVLANPEMKAIVVAEIINSFPKVTDAEPALGNKAVDMKIQFQTSAKGM